MKIFDFFKIGRRDPQKQLKEMLKGYELPSFPGAVMTVINKLRDPDSPMTEIASLIKSDPGMHVMVLKTVNSAAFGLTRKVSNIQQATTLMGRSRLETLILPLGVKSSIPKIKCSCIDMKSFWLAAARRACLADSIASLVHPATKMESFTAGLLQDMAIPVLIDVMQTTYCKTLEDWHEEGTAPLHQLEKDQHGYDHQTVGALMATEWNLPEYLVNAIAAHHLDDDKLAEPAVRLVSYIRYKDAEQPIEEYTFELIRDKLSIKEERISSLVKNAFANAEEYAAIMN